MEIDRKGRLWLRLTREIVAALATRRIYLHDTGTPPKRPRVSALAFQAATLVEPYCGVFAGEAMPSTGAFSYSHSPVHAKQVIGRYCSIATDVAWLGSHHPLRSLSTSSFAFDPGAALCRVAAQDAGAVIDFPGMAPEDRPGRIPRLEHDVWIGQGAYIGKNVVLKTGSVVGARAVVTKSVEPYSIVAGNPARVVRMRFPEKTVARLLDSRWWDYGFPEFAGMPIHDPERFLGAFHDAREAGRLKPLPPARLFSEIVQEIEAELG